MTVDVSKGRGKDYSVFNVVDISQQPFKQVAVYRHNRISPLLFPNIIAKYGKIYNDAYVVIESNDQGALVAKELLYELEYENLHVEPASKHHALGIFMDKKVKRLGCSSIKDLVEHHAIKVVDKETIKEMTTFVAKGTSFEASDANKDDIVMTLVMFGYFALTNKFGELSDISLKEMMHLERIQQIEDDIVPFGFIDDGLGQGGLDLIEITDPKSHWQVVTDWRYPEDDRDGWHNYRE
jgi:hypothetical protein